MLCHMNPVLIMLTFAANTKYFHGIPGRGEIILFSRFFLQFFNLATGHLNNPTAFDAY